jgi:DNA-binding NarL/FixJ family response regulator
VSWTITRHFCAVSNGWWAPTNTYGLLGSHLHVADIDFEHDQVPDVVVLDLYLGRDDELSTPWIQRLVDWGTKVLLHTSVELAVPPARRGLGRSRRLSLKADGLDSLYNSICAVADGEFACSSPLAQALVSDPELIARLSQREREVVSGLDDGLTQQQIARRMHVEPSTVKEHLKSVRHKYLALDAPLPTLTRSSGKPSGTAGCDERGVGRFLPRLGG